MHRFLLSIGMYGFYTGERKPIPATIVSVLYVNTFCLLSRGVHTSNPPHMTHFAVLAKPYSIAGLQ